MARRQSMVAILLLILPNHLQELAEDLKPISDDVRRNDNLAFENVATAHFARLAILPAVGTGPSAAGPRLLFASVYDGPLPEHLDEWLAVGGNRLAKILAHCQDYPSRGADRPHAVRDYLLSRQIGYETFYRGHPDRTVPQVRGELALRAVIDRHLDRLVGVEAAAIRQRLRDVVGADDDMAWALNEPARPRLAPLRGRDLIGLAASVAILALLVWRPWIGVAVLLGLAAAAAGWLLAIRQAEIREAANAAPATIDDMRRAELADREDRIAQNQLTHLVDIKPGFLRATTLRTVLWAIDVLARYRYTRGNLGGIPTIHFASWSIIDGGRRLLFLSNYDGSWESYLGDFIDYAATGLTSIWSNTVGFPPTRWLLREGARHEQDFKAWTRAHQVPSQVWYSWYRDLSVANVNRNSSVRRGLAGPGARRPDSAWVRQLLG